MRTLTARGRTRLEDYTKYKLKCKDELESLLENRDNLVVLTCKKCYKEFTAGEEPEFADFTSLAAEHGKSIAGSAEVDFLCNKTMAEKALKAQIPDGSESIFVIACGLGVQTVTGLMAPSMPDASKKSNAPAVIAACDSIDHGGSHGLSLTKLRCGACGQCYLNHTGGICPIAECSKSLINGPCGGSKNYRCEIDKSKGCAWHRISERLAASGQADELREQPVQLRDYSNVNFKMIKKHVRAIREKRLYGFYGGVYPTDHKDLSEQLPLKAFPPPQLAVLPMSQHIGAPAIPLVKVGDMVKKGQKIADAANTSENLIPRNINKKQDMSVPPNPSYPSSQLTASDRISCAIHSSISGTVVAVEPRQHPNTGLDALSVVISSDGKDELHDSVKPQDNWQELSPDDIIALIQEKGIVGMGGAGFPTSAKLRRAALARAQEARGGDIPQLSVLLNGCECEPYLTADHRVMLEYADDVVFGLKILMKATGAEKGFIVIEENKRDAIELIQSKTSHIPEIAIIPVRTKYPQGAEKMLIKRALGLDVPSGALPIDIGVLVNNVSTAKAVSDAILTGMPLIERAVTVSGEKIKTPGNYIVRTGTPVQSLIDHCGGMTANDAIIKVGGPMMGIGLEDLDAPVIKTTTGIIAIEPPVTAPSPCIRCGRCSDVCPMELSPLYYPQFAEIANWEAMEEKAVQDCIECGCCDYVCPSKIPITNAVKLGKLHILRKC